MTTEEIKKEKIDKLKEQIHKFPYTFICDYTENLYPQTGKKVFEILSLMPVSLIIPDIPYMNKTIRSNINALFLSSSGGGKTSIADLFAYFTYYPLRIESITSSALEYEINKNPVCSIIVGDFARISRDPVTIKVLEGVLGEEKRIMRKTMRTDINIETQSVSLLCGVATDLHFYVLGGLIFRVMPILLGHTASEHSDIGRHLKEQIGEENSIDYREQVIKEFYLELASIQDGKHQTIKPIIGYHIEKKYREESYKEWDNMTQSIVKELGMNLFREYQEFYRILLSHAFINIFNRKVIDGKLYPNDEDFKVALKLMKRNIIFKYRLMKTESMAKGIRSTKEFNNILQDNRVPEEYKQILRNMVKVRGGRVSLG